MNQYITIERALYSTVLCKHVKRESRYKFKTLTSSPSARRGSESKDSIRVGNVGWLVEPKIPHTGTSTDGVEGCRGEFSLDCRLQCAYLSYVGTVSDLPCSVCVFSSHPFWTSSSLDVPAGVTQEEGHTGFFIHLPSAVRALIFVARRIQPFLSLVDREVEFCVLTN